MIPFDQDPFQVSLQEDALQSKLSDLGIQKRLVAKTFKWTYFMQSLGNGLKSLAPKLMFLLKQFCYNNGRRKCFLIAIIS